MEKLRILVLAVTPPSQQVEMVLTTARHHHPDAEIIQISDETGEIFPGFDGVWRVPKQPNFDLVRMLNLGNNDDRPTVSLDSDVLVCGGLWKAFDQDFEVGLCLRSNISDEKQPYNTGVIFSRCSSFFRETYEKEKDRLRPPRNEQHVYAEEAMSKRWDVCDLPGDVWNFSPGRKKFHKARVFHYKGDRKSYMREHFLANVWR